jgi:hypothetical protein
MFIYVRAGWRSVGDATKATRDKIIKFKQKQIKKSKRAKMIENSAP